MDSSPSASKALEPSLPSAAGTKRPAPSLLPPFEPLSSSPGFPRPLKRQATSSAFSKYPTPIPTSSTGILSSSPPRCGPRPSLQRTASIVSERAPLSDVRTVELKEDGETLLMGRSSNSSHYQLSANRLISRVHVKARYISATEALDVNKVEIICNGWNGLKLHCQGQTWELGKGDSFTSETDGAEIMLDVQDARVLLQWPKRDKDRDALGNLSDSSWDESPRPITGRSAHADLLGSPLRRTTRIGSPESPTPANVSTSSASLEDLMPDGHDLGEAVEIYEDASADEQELPKLTDVDASFMTQATESFSSDLSDPQSDNDPDEENDPIIHSFGPFGANLSGRLASFSTMSPKRRLGATLEPLHESKPASANVSPGADAERTPVESSLNVEEKAAVSNHVVNQLAFSRLSSTPLSTILNNLPAEERKDLTKDQLRIIIESTVAVGIIPRQGKDAAGKPLESEYYYIPEMDTDEHRRLAVTDGLRKPSLRNCRKQHKQYYWKRPRTP
ncbi:protein PLM2 [Rhypophila decipiens]|uniref:Protein PLM2 n=1 Tax=Rhypophila decipiens TaxID=261697 RepID=A0AAN6XYF2_9PEZI|nr:protein PLM2 [Rhypophila decipiens]